MEIKRSISYKVLFIYNPSSGKGKIKKNLDFIVGEIVKKYGSCDIVESKSKEDLQDNVRRACETYDYLFFSGGDGTFNLVVNSIPNLKHLPIFGYVPGGSTNDMGYNLNISNNVKKGIFDLLNSKPKTYNVGYIGEHKFIYVASCGTLTDVAHLTPTNLKKKLGWLAYLTFGLKRALTMKSRAIMLNGVMYSTPLFLISNSKEIASFRINPENTQDRGEYYCCIVKDGPLSGAFNIMYLFAFGLDKAIKKKRVISFDAPLFQINCDNEVWDLDGERANLKFPTTAGFSGLSIQVFCNRE